MEGKGGREKEKGRQKKPKKRGTMEKKKNEAWADNKTDWGIKSTEGEKSDGN